MSTQKLKIHFIGIGGIGVSALARYYLGRGYKVTGSDLAQSEITKSLEALGVKVWFGKHKAQNLPKGADLVVYSPAVKPNNLEFKEAEKRGKELQSYPQALGELTKNHFTIAVSGTHGKSTTTAMMALVLIESGLDPTVIVGTKLKELGNSNCRVGKSKYLLIEADEHFASFLNYWPKIIVLTSIEADHLDYYRNLDNILKAFKKYLNHLPEDGIVVANQDDVNTQKVLTPRLKIRGYSLKNQETNKLEQILKVPGEHNIANALAVLTAARALKIPDRTSYRAISEYKGSWRRFEVKEKLLGAKRYTLINDYAHHPTEVRVTLEASRQKYPKKKIWCVFQPHQHQRTHYLFNDFVKTLKEAVRLVEGRPQIDILIITDIYDVAGREEKAIKKKVSSQKLVEVVKEQRVIYLPKGKIISYLTRHLKGGEVVIIMGAGDIYNLNVSLDRLGRKEGK